MTSKLNRKESRHARTPHGEMDGWCLAGRRDRPGRSDPARAVDPITIGFGMALTGGLAPNGKAALLAMQIWAEEINAKGGLLGPPIKLIYYDDHRGDETLGYQASGGAPPALILRKGTRRARGVDL
jgi:ABC-type branched-subunit amino acid transport system substrate-binding protein